MRVAVVTAFPIDPSSPHGGVEAVSVNLVRALQALDDLSVEVVTLDEDASSVRTTEWEGVIVHQLPRTGVSTLVEAIGSGRKQMRNFLHSLGVDVVHAHDTYGLMVKNLRVPRVFTIHGFIYGDTRVSGTKFSRLRSWVWYWVETGGWANQPNIISISPYVRERVSRAAKGTIYDIDNPIDSSCFSIARHEEPYSIFSAAVICKRKNPHVLVEATRLLRDRGVDASLRLAGKSVEPAYDHRLRCCIQDLDLGDNVTLLGGVTANEVRKELGRSSVFALVSLEENSPMGIEEAMAAGVPVVTSNRCGMPYMVRDGETGYLVNPHDPVEIADRLQRILEDDALRRSMGEKGRQTALERFHPDVVARRTREVYYRAVEGAKRGRS